MSKRNYKLSSRYARALKAALSDKQALKSVGEALKAVGEAYEQNSDFRELALDPAISLETKKKVLSGLKPNLGDSQELHNFLIMLAERGRLQLLPQISECFQQEIAKAFEIENVEVVSAAELSQEDKDEISAKLSQGKQCSIAWEVDPSLIAGLVIKTSGSVVDSSVKGRLKTIKETLRV